MAIDNTELHDEAFIKQLNADILLTLRKLNAVLEIPTGTLGTLIVTQEVQERLHKANKPATIQHAILRLVETHTRQLSNVDADLAKLLNDRFFQDTKTKEIALARNLSQDQVNRHQKRAIKLVATSIISAEKLARASYINRLESKLKAPSYKKLFGFGSALAKLKAKVAPAGSDYVALIVGLGGIGKTALCDALTRDLIATRHFRDAIWIRIEPKWDTDVPVPPEQLLDQITASLFSELFPNERSVVLPAARLEKIRHQLRRAPYLVVIDNLEAPSDYPQIITQLNDWSNPSQFILTTRWHELGETGAFAHTLSALEHSDALALLKSQVQETGARELKNAEDSVYNDIYNKVGGNPLALKLIVGLTHTISLKAALTDLKHVSTDTIDGMYRRIYLQAWHSLSPNSKELLSSMPLVDQDKGGGIEQLIQISGLDSKAIVQAVLDLAKRSLLEVRGIGDDIRYAIHRLTETFLNTDVNYWGPGATGDDDLSAEDKNDEDDLSADDENDEDDTDADGTSD